METIFYLFFKMRLEKLSLVIEDMNKMGEKEGFGKIDIGFLDPLNVTNVTSVTENDLFHPVESPILSGVFSTPGKIATISFFIGINNVRVHSDNQNNLIYSGDLSKESIASAFMIFTAQCIDFAFISVRNSITNLILSKEDGIKELEKKTEKNTVIIDREKNTLSILTKRLHDFDEKFSVLCSK